MASVIIDGSSACDIQRRWQVDPTLAEMVVALASRAARDFTAAGLGWAGLFIISGYRSPSLQAQVNPSVTKSRHTECPALAVDLRIADLPASVIDPVVWARIGRIWQAMGGRWGGTFKPPDWNHFDIPDTGPFF